MPNRILRDSIRTSKSLSLLSAEIERLFYRLLVYADDQGRFDARPAVILGACFPLLMDRITVADVLTWIQRLADDEIGILVLYGVEGSDRTYGAFRNWAQYQRMRSSDSKYPPPPQVAANCGKLPQTAASVRTHGVGVGDGIGDGDVPPLSPPQGGKKVKRQTEVDEPFRERMRQKYSAALGNDVDDVMAEAMSHKARLKWIDPQRYVDGWLRRASQWVRPPTTGPPRSSGRATRVEARSDPNDFKDGF